MNAFEFLRNWYQENCNGDWEHQYGISINTIDNPGWQVKIDLANTSMEGYNINYHLVENSVNDWFGYSIRDNVFNAAGDPNKLEKILNIFMELSESENPIPDM